MKFLSLLPLLALAPSAHAVPVGKCANFAKFAAIKAYMSSVAGAERDGLVAKADLFMLNRQAVESWNVTVESPCSVDGDDSNCSASYEVQVQYKNAQCKVLKVKEVR